MARVINTVTGPISADDLGGVLVHEHFVFGYPGYQGDESFNEFDFDVYMQYISAKVQDAMKLGVKTIVDVTPNDCGRDVTLLKAIAEKNGLNIMCTTGYYYQEEGASGYFLQRQSLGFPVEDEIYSLMKRELNEGIGKTGIKASAIKLGSGIGGPNEYELLFFRAAAKLANEDKDVRIITHTTGGTGIIEQADFFLAAGVDPKQVQIGHVCLTTDSSIHENVLEKGFYIAFDKLGLVLLGGAPEDPPRFDCISELIKKGYGKQILLSNDKVQLTLGRPVIYPPEIIETYAKNWDWDYIMTGVMDALKERGATDEQLHNLVYENPKAFYSEF